MRFTISEINAMSTDEFVRRFGGVFERSPWIAKAAFSRRPFQDFAGLHQAMCDTVRNTSEEQQLELILVHPDLVGRAALAGTLTRESTSEQASAGLNKLTPEEIAAFQQNNEAYREKFDFPFIICARLNKKEAILAGFAQRLNNTREQEVQTALQEIFKIAELRLRDLVSE